MTRPIDADAVYKILESCEIRKATIGNPLTDWEYGYTCGIERAESEIECAPTVDAVPVIRCKDCKYYEIVELNADGTPDKRFKPSICANGWYEYAVERDPNWFCADAEPKETE